MKQTNIIYILSIKTGSEKELKIGITNDLNKRLKSLQTGNSEKIHVEHTEEIDKNINIRKMENWIHSTFDKYRKQGEWFKGIEVKKVRKMILMYLVK